MGFKGKFDRESGLVEVSGTEMELESVDHVIKWLKDVSGWLNHQKMVENGGWRWEFRRGEKPTARMMKGLRVWAQEFELVTIRPRKRRKCAACDAEIEAGTACWRQSPGLYRGHSHDRFCQRCVERGAAPRPPKLRLVMGEG